MRKALVTNTFIYFYARCGRTLTGVGKLKNHKCLGIFFRLNEIFNKEPNILGRFLVSQWKNCIPINDGIKKNRLPWNCKACQ